VKAAAGTATGHLPGPAAGLPHAGEKNARVGGIEADVATAGVGVLDQDALPKLAAVGGAVDAALRARAKGVAQDRGKCDIRIGRVNDHRADLPLLLPDLLPGFARVGGLVDAVARCDVAANVAF